MTSNDLVQFYKANPGAYLGNFGKGPESTLRLLHGPHGVVLHMSAAWSELPSLLGVCGTLTTTTTELKCLTPTQELIYVVSGEGGGSEVGQLAAWPSWSDIACVCCCVRAAIASNSMRQTLQIAESNAGI